MIHLSVTFPRHQQPKGRQPADSLVSIRTEACGLVVLGAVDVGAVVESSVSPPDGSPPTLVEEMPVEARKRSVLRALVLQEQRALLCPELLQVPETTQKTNIIIVFGR